ncbi:MAG TPA: hypothetical protein VG826_09310 [Pirellulales bacterium]|nr:hypothetical protein [Pirellulales bacterium]
MAGRLTFSTQRASGFLPALRLSAVVFAFACGCQNDGELANRNDGLAQSLTPQGVDAYARQRNIPKDQARRELQEAMSKRDADEAVKNIDEAGVTTTQ